MLWIYPGESGMGGYKKRPAENKSDSRRGRDGVEKRQLVRTLPQWEKDFRGGKSAREGEEKQQRRRRKGDIQRGTQFNTRGTRKAGKNSSVIQREKSHSRRLATTQI